MDETPNADGGAAAAQASATPDAARSSGGTAAGFTAAQLIGLGWMMLALIGGAWTIGTTLLARMDAQDATMLGRIDAQARETRETLGADFTKLGTEVRASIAVQSAKTSDLNREVGMLLERVGASKPKPKP